MDFGGEPTKFFACFLTFSFLLAVRHGLEIVNWPWYTTLTKFWFTLVIIFIFKRTRQTGGSCFGNNDLALYYCCIYDSISESESVFDLACTFSIVKGIGLGNSAYFLVIPMFGFVLESETLKNVIRAVIVPVSSIY